MKTLIEFIEGNCTRYAANPYMWEKKSGKYHSTTYAQTLEHTRTFAAGLMALGVEKADRVALLSEGRNHWVISEFGILFAGAINVPLSVKLNPSELQFRLLHSETSVLIISERQYPNYEHIRKNLGALRHVILLDPREQYRENEMSMKKVMEMGAQFLQKHPEEVASRSKGVKPADCANISYTSGTTADPKGIMLSHRNYTANVEQAQSLMHIPEAYRTLLILPLDHSFAHTAGIYSFMVKGASIGFLELGKTPQETLRNIPVNIKELQPDLLMSVPALAKNFRKGIESAIRAKGSLTEKLFNDALETAYQYNREGFNKERWNIIARMKLMIYDKLIFSKIRENFGGKLKFFIGGGALLDIELQRFFYALGMPMFQGYGLSEATPIISSNVPHQHKLGSSGTLVKPMELRILDEDGKDVPVGEKGEIVIKGENVMLGYWKNPQATEDTIRQGWLHTGDMGYVDEDGFLYVLGRYKSLLIGHDGEKYSPESIEEALADQSPLIDQVMLHNNQDPFTIGLIVPNREALIGKLKKEGITDVNSDAAVSRAIDLLEAEVLAYKSGGRYADMFPERWLPSTVGFLSESFTEDNLMLNSTLKMVRGKIEEHYSGLMQYLYLPEAKSMHHPKNLEALKKLLSR
ncbi:MAG: AMP-binding protein [Bacteroidetes bacterium]|nr:AMP-binding protein [Bacteroidota bacterium]